MRTKLWLSLLPFAAALALPLLAASCGPTKGSGDGITASTHTFFPIGQGTAHELVKVASCESCHAPEAPSFKEVSCVGCHIHDQGISDLMHGTMTGYSFGPKTCLSCHPTGEPLAPFAHRYISGSCATCHDETTPFAALPKAGFTHPARGTADCGGCHQTSSWKNASQAPNDSSDPLSNYNVDGLIPTWSDTTIVSVAPLAQSLPMTMNHQSTQLPASLLANCAGCHIDASKGSYYPGNFHASIIALGVSAPTSCVDCHTKSRPQGFVGPTATSPARSPASGEMRHDAVAWVNGKPGTASLLPADCVQCHQTPADGVDGQWSTAKDGGTGIEFHASLTPAQQPAACLDCHANTRPTMPVVLSTGLAFDHQSGDALGECKTCHTTPAALAGQSWAGGLFHSNNAPKPATCDNCHEAKRPADTTGWQSTTYRNSPFDYGTNARSIKHGAGEDCAVCHSSTTTWVGGAFSHGANTIASSQCISCHSTQRPDLQAGATASGMATLLGFDHSKDGTGDCFGCHQATVTANKYVNYNNPATGTLPGGDWKDGIAYPASFVSSTSESITVPSIQLTRNAANFITGVNPVSLTLYNGMLHTSAALPAALSGGPANMPDYSKCWHCHTNTSGTVTAYSGGKYHSSLTNFKATPGGTTSAQPQPTSRCNDCHSTMWPKNIVQKGTTNLQPMDHASQFTAPANIGGKTVSAVNELDCSTCHKAPGNTWSDGAFHASIGTATPKECAGGCHYPLMADAAKADVTSATTYKMVHRSGQVTNQKCETCHTSALSKAAQTPIAATLWKTGAYHSTLTSQPATCTECHTVSKPAAATQGTVSYALPQGGTSSNQAQWMNHASSAIAGKECAVCHLNDAKALNSAWNKASTFHAGVPTVNSCRECHGLTNGKGTTVGTNNNMPTGLNDSSTTTSASAATGVAGVKDQIAHTDVNVTNNDCKLCHTQAGPSTVAGVQGREWAVAKFHKNFTTATPLVMNGTTGRCSNCHLNVKPTAAYTKQAHAAFTATSAQDCSSCHAYPGTSATSPNWLGATGAHASSGSTTTSTLDCNSCHGQGGSSSTHLNVAASAHYGGVSNGNKCTSCHIEFSGFKGTITNLRYGHTNSTANSGGCVTCHAFSGQLYTTLTTTPPLSYPTATGGHQFSQTRSVTGSFSGDSFSGNHTNSGLTRCGACHQYSTTSSTTNIWTFRHRPSNPGISNSKSTSGCNMCH